LESDLSTPQADASLGQCLRAEHLALANLGRAGRPCSLTPGGPATLADGQAGAAGRPNWNATGQARAPCVRP
jgi:hypothetical protein